MKISDKLLTPLQVASMLGVSRSTARRMMLENVIPTVILRTGKRKKIYRCRLISLTKWIEKRERK